MATFTDRILLGLKIRHLRQESGLSFAELSAKTGLSGSYLNEIEKGKKTPRPEKLAALAATLSVTPEWLLSEDPGPHLAPVASLLRSNFLNELPLDMFGIDLSRLLELLASAPLQINAFVSSLVELAQNHARGRTTSTCQPCGPTRTQQQLFSGTGRGCQSMPGPIRSPPGRTPHTGPTQTDIDQRIWHPHDPGRTQSIP
ncbi:MAG: helix-turn-helix transcriptional regulator [Saprospiraceae bacterium]|nr:helix-turn-helix transcriptional regulator [Saprospiraceae bacterium]